MFDVLRSGISSAKNPGSRVQVHFHGRNECTIVGIHQQGSCEFMANISLVRQLRQIHLVLCPLVGDFTPVVDKYAKRRFGAGTGLNTSGSNWLRQRRQCDTLVIQKPPGSLRRGE